MKKKMRDAIVKVAKKKAAYLLIAVPSLWIMASIIGLCLFYGPVGTKVMVSGAYTHTEKAVWEASHVDDLFVAIRTKAREIFGGSMAGSSLKTILLRSLLLSLLFAPIGLLQPDEPY